MNLADRLTSHLPPRLWALVREAAVLADKRRQPAAIVGGVVRDAILNRSTIDVDLMLEAPVEPVVRELAHAHRVIQVPRVWRRADTYSNADAHSHSDAHSDTGRPEQPDRDSGFQQSDQSCLDRQCQQRNRVQD